MGCLHALPVFALARPRFPQSVGMMLVALYLLNPVFLGDPRWATPLILWALWALDRRERVAYILAISGAALAHASWIELLMLSLLAVPRRAWALPPLLAALAVGFTDNWPFLLDASQLARSLGWHLSPLAWLPLAAPMGLIASLPLLLVSGSVPACGAALPFYFGPQSRG